MKRILLLSLLIPCLAQSQVKLFNPENRNKGFWRKQSVVVGAAGYAGFRRHERDVLRDYYIKGYLRVFPGANQQWSNPRLSAVNKFKPGTTEPKFKFLGLSSTHELAFATDKWHLNNFLEMVLLAGACGISITLYRWPKGVGFWKVAGRVVTEGFIVHAMHSLGKATCFKFYGL